MFLSDLPFAHSDLSIPWPLFLFRGRRQLPQAGEVRRPPGVWLLVGSGQGGECLICNTFYSVLGQGLVGTRPSWGVRVSKGGECLICSTNSMNIYG